MVTRIPRDLGSAAASSTPESHTLGAYSVPGVRWGAREVGPGNWSSVPRDHVAAVALADALERDLVDRARRLQEAIAATLGGEA